MYGAEAEHYENREELTRQFLLAWQIRHQPVRPSGEGEGGGWARGWGRTTHVTREERKWNVQITISHPDYLGWGGGGGGGEKKNRPTLLLMKNKHRKFE